MQIIQYKKPVNILKLKILLEYTLNFNNYSEILMNRNYADSSDTLGEYHDDETMANENKAVHIPMDYIANMELSDIFKIVNGVINNEFKLIIKNNFLNYLNILPKYISCFANAGINGVVNMGVNDSCEITGLPVFGDIYKDEISASIRNIVAQNVKCKLSSDEIVDRITIEYILLNVDIDILEDDACKLYSQFSKKIIEYNDQMDEYNEKHALFLINHRKYSQRIESIINTTKYRLELIEYIKKAENSSSIVIQKLEQHEFIMLEDDNIATDRDNIDRLFYWIALFKNEMTAKIRKTKPKKPIYPSIYHPRQIICNLPCMRYKFIKKCPHIKYYMLKIKCNMSGINSTVEFKDQYSGEWLKKTRVNCTETNCSPGCM